MKIITTTISLTDNFIEFDSMINLRPAQGNKSRAIDNLLLQKRIRTVVNKLIIP